MLLCDLRCILLVDGQLIDQAHLETHDRGPLMVLLSLWILTDTDAASLYQCFPSRSHWTSSCFGSIGHSTGHLESIAHSSHVTCLSWSSSGINFASSGSPLHCPHSGPWCSWVAATFTEGGTCVGGSVSCASSSAKVSTKANYSSLNKFNNIMSKVLENRKSAFALATKKEIEITHLMSLAYHNLYKCSFACYQPTTETYYR